jgi:ribonuclease E
MYTMETQNQNYGRNGNPDVKEPMEGNQGHDTATDKSDILGGPAADETENSTTDDGNVGYADVDNLLDDVDDRPGGDDDEDLDEDDDIDLDDDDLDLDEDIDDDPETGDEPETDDDLNDQRI